MQVLCGLQVVFFLFNCQTPGRPGTFKALGIHMEYLIPENTSQPGKVAAAFNSMYNEKNTSDAFADSVKE